METFFVTKVSITFFLRLYYIFLRTAVQFSFTFTAVYLNNCNDVKNFNNN
jgi:hypothetical protein